jgi:hypothetical protein
MTVLSATTTYNCGTEFSKCYFQDRQQSYSCSLVLVKQTPAEDNSIVRLHQLPAAIVNQLMPGSDTCAATAVRQRCHTS